MLEPAGIAEIKFRKPAEEERIPEPVSPHPPRRPRVGEKERPEEQEAPEAEGEDEEEGDYVLDDKAEPLYASQLQHCASVATVRLQLELTWS